MAECYRIIFRDIVVVLSGNGGVNNQTRIRQDRGGKHEENADHQRENRNNLSLSIHRSSFRFDNPTVTRKNENMIAT
jgi:hypothetical protein